MYIIVLLYLLYTSTKEDTVVISVVKFYYTLKQYSISAQLKLGYLLIG